MIGSCIKHVPIAGRDITFFIQQLLRDREVGIPPEQSLETAKAVKVPKSSSSPPHLPVLFMYSSTAPPPQLDFPFHLSLINEEVPWDKKDLFFGGDLDNTSLLNHTLHKNVCILTYLYVFMCVGAVLLHLSRHREGVHKVRL